VRACICLPTYDERENIEPMLLALGAVIGPDDRVLVVDDGSPDGTGAIAARLAEELPFVDVLHRERKEGIGRAYLAAFPRALATGAEYVLEMDCDFSHDPAVVPRLIEACEAGADVALGSRYVPGGATANWSPLRKAISRGGSFYARLFLGVPVRDLTGGFKCFRRAVLEAIDLETIRSRGYAFQVELTHRAIHAGFRVVELPIVFRDRRLGRSKMSWRIAGEAALLLPQLRMRLPGRISGHRRGG
jgi:dolichol-phosphate mannosyltransferase